MSPLLLAAEGREASPIALVLILGLLIAVVLLVRSMNKHLRRLPASFDQQEPARPAEPGPDPEAGTRDR